jgi:hypothetical protein
MILVGIASIYQFSEVSDLTTGNILTTTSATYVDVSGISFSTSNAVNGDVLVIAANYTLLGSSGSQCRAIITVDENGTLTDVAPSERTNDVSETLHASVVTKYVMSHSPTNTVTTVKLRAKRAFGAGNAIVASPVNLFVAWTRGQ